MEEGWSKEGNHLPHIHKKRRKKEVGKKSMSTYLDKELAKASFNIKELSHFLYGGKDQYEAIKRWQSIFDKEPIFNGRDDAFLPREQLVKRSLQRALKSYDIMKANKDLLGAHSPLHGEGGMSIGRLSNNHCGITDHYALFVQTILSQGTPEQVREWVPKALNLEIIGTYGQTELGHGSNVRALETIATYEPETDTILVDMPTITAMKWWPGALGLLATHAVVYCRLIVAGKDLGFHAIMVQIRDHEHKPLPGVEVGDIGPKMGANSLDSGYLYLRKVRVPRFNLLAKFQQLAKGGAYTQAPPHLSKVAYVTMMKARVIIVQGAYGALGRGLTIALRYNAFRKQGFVDSKKGIAGGERAIIDYPMQQFRMYPLVGATFGMFFGARRLLQLLKAFDASVKAAGKDVEKIDTSMLPELHATSAGLKAFCTELAANGLEEARKCCGGQGYMSSGIARLVVDYMPAVTYEGDRIPMALQTARTLLGALTGKVPKTGSFAYLARKDNTTLSNTDDASHLVKVWETVARSAVHAAGRLLFEANTLLKNSDKAWNHCHVQLIGAAHAHTMFQLVDAFSQGLKDAPAAAQKPLLDLLRLFALTKLSDVSVVFSKLTGEQGASIDKAVKQLLITLRPNVLGLLEGFEWTDRQLESLIALKSDDIYEALFDWSKRSPLNKPEYVERIHKEVLAKHLNAEYLKKGNSRPSKI